MSKGKGSIIDLISSSPSPPPEAGPSSAMANKRAYAAPASGSESGFSAPVPKIDQLAGQFYTRDGLHRHLISLGPETLSKMLLSKVHDNQFRPKPQVTKSIAEPQVHQNPFAHCIYCHKAYDRRQNQGCKVRHFGKLKDVSKYGDEKEWTCCGGEVSYVDYDSDCHGDPANEQPYCYIGKHWAEQIEGDDGQGGAWWGEWGGSGWTCADIGCNREIERVIRAGIPVAKKVRR